MSGVNCAYRIDWCTQVQKEWQRAVLTTVAYLPSPAHALPNLPNLAAVGLGLALWTAHSTEGTKSSYINMFQGWWSAVNGWCGPAGAAMPHITTDQDPALFGAACAVLNREHGHWYAS